MLPRCRSKTLRQGFSFSAEAGDGGPKNSGYALTIVGPLPSVGRAS